MLLWVDSQLSYVCGGVSLLTFRLPWADFSGAKASTGTCSRKSVEALIKWGTVENDLVVLTYHTVPHTAAHSGINSQTHTSNHSHCSINTTTREKRSSKTYHPIFILFSPLLCLFFLSFWLNALVSVHTYFGMASRARDSTPTPLLRQIQTSIKRHMARFSLSDMWCRCTFWKRRAGAAAALLVKPGGQDGSGATHCIY